MRYCSACGAALPSPPPVTCGECGTEHWRNPKPCAGALVIRDGMLLLIKRATEPWKGRWDIPGGFCDHDEHPEAAAVREVREETGLDVTIDGFFGMWLDRYEDAEEITLNIYYRASVVGGAERPQRGEVEELRWFPKEALPSRDELAFPDHATQVLDGLP